MSKSRGSIRRRSTGKYEVRVAAGRDVLTGRYRQISRTADTEQEAERLRVELLHKLDQGRAEASNTLRMDFLFDRWLNQIEDVRAVTTMRSHRSKVDVHILPALGHLPVRQVTPAVLDELYTALRRERGLAPATIRQIHAIVHRALEQAVKWEWLDRNPASRATAPTVRPVKRSAPTIDDLSKIVALADAEFAVFLRLAAATGARRGELCGLRRGDFVDGTVLVERAVIDVRKGETQVKSTKTHSARVVAVDAATVAAVQGHNDHMDLRAMAAEVGTVDNPYVFSHALDLGEPWRPDYVTLAFRRLAKRAGVATTFHSIRHLSATYLLDAGVPLKTVSDRLGHARASTTQDIYGHAVDGRDRAAADVMGGLLDG